jgi:hypothetical protein
MGLANVVQALELQALYAQLHIRLLAQSRVDQCLIQRILVEIMLLEIILLEIIQELDFIKLIQPFHQQVLDL